MVFKIRPAAIRQSSISPINARTPYVLLVTSWLSMVLLVVMVLIYAIRSPSFTSEAIGHLCPDNQVLVNTHLFSGSYLIIDNQPTEMPKIEHGDFIQSAHDFMYSETLPDFLQIEVPAIIANVIDTKTSTGLWLISNGITLPADQDIQICVQPSDNQATRGMGFVYFKSYPEAIGLQTN
jgi:hypothetical protein